MNPGPGEQKPNKIPPGRGENSLQSVENGEDRALTGAFRWLSQTAPILSFNATILASHAPAIVPHSGF